jgi:hypothetical protein
MMHLPEIHYADASIQTTLAKRGSRPAGVPVAICLVTSRVQLWRDKSKRVEVTSVYVNIPEFGSFQISIENRLRLPTRR